MAVKKRAPVDWAKSGSVKLPIYFSPLKKKLEGRSNGGGAENVPGELKFKVYNSFVIYYYEKGRRKKVRFAALADAKQDGKELAKKLATEGNENLVLPQAECRVYFTAKAILKPHGLEVDAGARLLHEALSRLKGATLNQVIDFFNAHGQRVLISATPAEAYAAYQQDMVQRGVSKYHQRDVRRFVGAFVKAFPLSLGVITTSDTDGWLAKLGGKARNKNNGRDKLIAFFNFLEKKNYLPKGGADVAKGTTSFNDPRQVISTEEEAAASVTDTDIYTPEEMSKILSLAEPEVRVTMEIKAFSGIRTEELSRLWWILVNEAAGYISITDAIAKVNQRTVPILANLKRRLASYPESIKKDLASKTWLSANALYHAWKRATDAAGVPYKKNGFRNSFISYRLAVVRGGANMLPPRRFENVV